MVDAIEMGEACGVLVGSHDESTRGILTLLSCDESSWQSPVEPLVSPHTDVVRVAMPLSDSRMVTAGETAWSCGGRRTTTVRNAFQHRQRKKGSHRWHKSIFLCRNRISKELPSHLHLLLSLFTHRGCFLVWSKVGKEGLHGSHGRPRGALSRSTTDTVIVGAAREGHKSIGLRVPLQSIENTILTPKHAPPTTVPQTSKSNESKPLDGTEGAPPRPTDTSKIAQPKLVECGELTVDEKFEAVFCRA